MKKASSHKPTDIEHAATLFFRLRGLVRSRLAQGRKLDPYAWLRIETLVYVRDTKEPTMRDIADYLSITAPSATSLIAALAKGGLIARKKDARDRRTVRLILTRKGHDKLAVAMRHGRAVFAKMFAALGKSEFGAFTSALEHVIKSEHGSTTR